MTTPNVYCIPAVNMERLKEEVEKLNKRADKLGCPHVKLTILKTVTKKKKDPLLGFEYDFVVHHCTIEGEAPMVKGWTLVAILEPQPNAEMLVREMPNQVCPAMFRKTDLACDHCGFKRRRNAVYVLREQEGEQGYMQVGKSCLKDFLQGASPEGMLASAEYIINFAKMASESEDEGWGYGGGKFERVLPVTQFVAVASVLIRKMGWTPRSRNTDYDTYDERAGNKEATADLAWRLIAYPHDDKNKKFVARNNIAIEGRDLDLADQSVDWAKGIDPVTAANTYMHDLGVCCRQAFVTWKTHGFVASVINAYQMDLAARMQAASPQRRGNFLGRINDAILVEDAKIVFMKQFPADGGKFKYDKTLVKFHSPEGNLLVWWASGYPEWLELNKTFNIQGTVISHTEYNGERQTVLKFVKTCQLTEA